MAAAQLASLWAQLQLLNQQIHTVERQIEDSLTALKTNTYDDSEQSSSTQPHPSDAAILASMPGVGAVVLANLLTETGSAVRDRDDAALRCLTGVAPVTKCSGKSRFVPRRRAVNARLVDSVYHGARVAIPVDPQCRQRYEVLRTRGHTHGRALRSVADRLLCVACAMLKNGTLFQKKPATKT